MSIHPKTLVFMFILFTINQPFDQILTYRLTNKRSNFIPDSTESSTKSSFRFGFLKTGTAGLFQFLSIAGLLVSTGIALVSFFYKVYEIVSGIDGQTESSQDENLEKLNKLLNTATEEAVEYNQEENKIWTFIQNNWLLLMCSLLLINVIVYLYLRLQKAHETVSYPYLIDPNQNCKNMKKIEKKKVKKNKKTKKIKQHAVDQNKKNSKKEKK